MKNIKKYDEFVNENMLTNYANKAIFEAFDLSVRALIKLLKLIFIFSDRNSKYMNEIEEEFITITKFTRFLYNNITKLNIDKLSNDEIKAFFKKASENYEKKFKRSFIDDITNWVNRLIVNNKKKNPNNPDTKTIIKMKKLLDIVNSKANMNPDIDPFEEDDWGPENDVITINTLYALIRQYENEFNWKEKVRQELKNRLVGKKVTFYPKTNFAFNDYKSKIVVKDVIYQDESVCLIDTDDVKHDTLLSFLLLVLDDTVSPNITILN